jgi:hypothetical protein
LHLAQADLAGFHCLALFLLFLLFLLLLYFCRNMGVYCFGLLRLVLFEIGLREDPQFLPEDGANIDGGSPRFEMCFGLLEGECALLDEVGGNECG